MCVNTVIVRVSSTDTDSKGVKGVLMDGLLVSELSEGTRR